MRRVASIFWILVLWVGFGQLASAKRKIDLDPRYSGKETILFNHLRRIDPALEEYAPLRGYHYFIVSVYSSKLEHIASYQTRKKYYIPYTEADVIGKENPRRAETEKADEIIEAQIVKEVVSAWKEWKEAEKALIKGCKVITNGVDGVLEKYLVRHRWSLFPDTEVPWVKTKVGEKKISGDWAYVSVNFLSLAGKPIDEGRSIIFHHKSGLWRFVWDSTFEPYISPERAKQLGIPWNVVRQFRLHLEP